MKRSLILLTAVAVIGCGSSTDVTDNEMPSESPLVHEDAPEPDRLADAPCGRPDWSQPPPEVISLEEAQD